MSNNLFITIPKEIVVHCLKFLYFKDVINLEFVNHHFKDLIKSVKWDYLIIIHNSPGTFISSRYDPQKTIVTRYYDSLDFITKKYGFSKIRLFNPEHELTNKIIKICNNYHTFDLYNCWTITDDHLELLSMSNCRVLILSNCGKITDRGVSYLGNREFDELDFSHCWRITDASVKLLKCRKLILSSCYQVTDDGIMFLDKCRYLDITWCRNVTDDCIKLLKDKGIEIVHVR